MKIGLIVPGFSADERDWCIPALLNLARSLAVSEEVHVFALRYPPRRDVYRVGGATVHSLNGRTRHGLSSVGLWRAALGALGSEHRRARFDVLHAVWGGEAGFVAILTSRWLRCPAVVSLVGGELVGLKDIAYGSELLPRQRLMNRAILRYADRLLCGSPELTERARSRLSPARRSRVETLTLGVDTQMFSPDSVGVRADGVRILNVGSLIPVKDHATLLRAFQGFSAACSKSQLSIVGQGPLEQDLRALAASRQLADRVHWAGAVSHERLPEWYRRADVFVQSSRHEVQAMATLEAAACGVAIAGTRVGIMPELADRGAALAVPPQDSEALAAAMQEAYATRQSLGRRARELVELEYSVPVVRERLLALYDSVRSEDAVGLVQPLARA